MNIYQLVLTSVLVVLAQPSSVPLLAQEIADLKPGDRVRIKARGGTGREFEGVLRTGNGTDLFVLPRGLDVVVHVPVPTIERIRVHRPRTRSGKGAMAGILIGGTAGALISQGSDAPVGFALGSLLGAGLGVGPRARRATLGMAALGMGLGAGVGLVLTGSAEKGGIYDVGALQGVGIVGGLFAVFFGGLGSAFGLITGEWTWESVPLPSAEPTLVVSPEGHFGVNISVPVRR